jgi:hypothetical protein
MNTTSQSNQQDARTALHPTENNSRTQIPASQQQPLQQQATATAALLTRRDSHGMHS